MPSETYLPLISPSERQRHEERVEQHEQQLAESGKRELRPSRSDGGFHKPRVQIAGSKTSSSSSSPRKRNTRLRPASAREARDKSHPAGMALASMNAALEPTMMEKKTQQMKKESTNELDNLEWGFVQNLQDSGVTLADTSILRQPSTTYIRRPKTEKKERQQDILW